MKWSSNGNVELSDLLLPLDATLMDTMRALEAGARGIAFVQANGGKVVGTVTDGDVRRSLLAGSTLQSRCLEEVMNKNFAYAVKSTGRAEVLDLMRARDIGQLPILDERGHLCGLHTIGEIISSHRRPNCAVVLAGGRGTRLAPLTESIPKPMVKVAGRPILERLVLHLMGHGVDRIYLAVNYLANVIEDHFGDGSKYGCTIHYLREEEALGTGGPLSLLPSGVSEPVLVLNGDLVTQCDFGRMLDAHAESGDVATFGVKPYTVQIPFGVARVDGGKLVEIREKPTERMLINAGIYVVSPEALKLVPPHRNFPITELFAMCIQRGMSVGTHLVEEEWEDIGRHEQLRRARGEE